MNKFEWRILQDQYSDDALHLLGKYSDLTFEKVMKSVKYLEHRSEKILRLIKFDEFEKTTIGIHIPPFSQLNFQDYSSLNHLKDIDPNLYQSFKAVEAYTSTREKEIFFLIESGYNVIDSNAFNILNYSRQKHMN